MSTWKRVVPEQSRKGDLIEQGSLECQEKIQYRWVNLNPKIDWVCDETTYTKYYKQKKQVSNDYGQTWGDVIPYQYQRGAAYETHSTDCGYVPPTPQYRWVNMDISTDWICEYVPETYKIHAIYSGGQTYEKDCDGNAKLTKDDTEPSPYDYTAMTEAVIGECVTEIGNQAFTACRSLTSVTIPNSVTIIGYRAFDDCPSLTSIAIPSGVTSIGIYAFNRCSGITRVNSDVDGVCNIPSGVTGIGAYAFQGCSSLTSIAMPSGLTIINDGIFNVCSNLTRVNSDVDGVCNIPSGVTSIGRLAFGNCSSLTSIAIPSGVTSIGYGAFQGCSGLTSIAIPSGVTSINDFTFNRCTSLTSIAIPSGVTTIGSQTFNSCSGLTSIAIPSGVTSIGDYAFIDCRSLTGITVEASTPPTLGTDAFRRTNVCPIYVPANSVNAYKTASGWSDYASRIRSIT